MADNKKKNTRPTQEEIVKGKIANALTSAAKNHIVATTDDIYDTDFQMYQDEINKLIFTGMTNEFTIHFYKKQEGSEETTWITDVKVTDENTLLTYPELKYSEFVNGGYWDTDITTIRNVTCETTVYYVTPFLTITDNETLLKICYNNGWSSSPDHLTINEAESITDEMVAEASKKLSLIEDEQGSLIEVFDSIIYEEEGEEPVVMTSYNLYDGLCYDKNGNEYNITDCCCYSKDGKRYSLGKVKYGNCFYELEPWTELPYFTGITKLSDGETYRVFLDYSHIRDINLENITSLPAYTLFRCANLENIFIPSGLTDIETYAIASCDGLQSLIVDENNPKYTSRNSQGIECNCIIEKPTGRVSELTLIQGCNVSILPDNIKHIASGAFDECTRLTSITLPDGLLTIGNNVFRGCTALSGNIIVPNTVESIGESTFRNCIALQGVNINTPSISNYLFKDCNSLSSVTLGNNVENIGNQTFMNCSSLTAITIPDGVTVAGTSAFNNCDLRSINTNNIGTISTNLFANNTHLSSVTMTDNTVNIGNESFANASITEITIPQNIRSLSNTAFINCNNLQRVVWDVNDTSLTDYTNKFINNANSINNFEFGEHCTVIPTNLCAYLVNIDEISIPNTITNIGNGAFRGCSGLTSIEIPNSVTSIGVWAFRGCTGLVSIEIPDSVTSIGVLTFENCNNLETVAIGNGITELDRAFVNCHNLETVDLSENENKITNNTDAFVGCENLSLIIVPDELITDYRESADWYEYREIIFGTSIYTITFDSVGGETTPSTQNVRCGAYIENPGTVHKDLYEFEYWEDEDGNEWNFEEDYVVGDMTLYAHYREVKAIMVKSISNDVTNISMSYNGSYQVNVEYSFDGRNWYTAPMSLFDEPIYISTNGDYNNYVYFRGYNPNGFSRDGGNYTCFNINNGQCDLLGNIMYLKNYDEELDYVNNYEFYDLFLNCYAIVNADDFVLPATELAQYCYGGIFGGCTSLANAPELPATTLASGCYDSMFANCSSLTTAPELPATTLANSCYSSMFQNCTNLTSAPELPATTLANSCYSFMFYSCSSLNYIKCLAINGVNNETINWTSNVASSGTFVKHPFANWYICDRRGIPCNWTTEDVEIQIDNYITFTALENNVPISLNRISSNQKLLYSTDDGETWNNFTTGVTITLANSGDTCYVAGMLSGNNSSSNYTQFSLPNRVSVSGNINSLWNYMDFVQNLYQYCGYFLFSSCTGLVDASGLSLGTSATTLANQCCQYMFVGCTSLTTPPELPATTLVPYCYYSMFYGCTSLTTAPELPANTLAEYCYNGMFSNCASLTIAQSILPATTLSNSCYQSMFQGCTGLTTAPALPATTLANSCYQSMFYGCTGLTTAPALPATTLANYCYNSMFSNCTSLSTAPELPATTLVQGCYNSMFRGCTSLTTAPELHATTLANNCYNSMFEGCSSLTTAPELHATTLASYCYNSMFNGCSRLNYIKCLAINWINQNNSTSMWVNGVANSGTFVKHPNATSWPTGVNGIPANWTVEDANIE